MIDHMKKVIEGLPGVEFVHIAVNSTWEIDTKKGLPPKSFKVYVLGGKKKQIAKVIWLHKPICALSVGNTRVRVADDFGINWLVSFERLL